MLTTQRETLRRRRRKALYRNLLIVAFVLVVIASAIGVFYYISTHPSSPDPDNPSGQDSTLSAENTSDTEDPDASSDSSPQENTESTANTVVISPSGSESDSHSGDALLTEADFQAAMYDYDKAISLLQTSPDYDSNPEYQQAVAGYQAEKNLLVKWPDNTQITHIFFHSLIVDNELCFNSPKADDYNQVMTTIPEFNAILDEMYARGYVLVSIYDIALPVEQADGSTVMTKQPIYLPEGKKPFVLSQDDLSYYEYMKGHGFASRLVVQEDGTVTCEMDLADGTSVRGSYDVVPILEDFIREHPDFCYRGARGTIALTGYEGVFGYRTSAYNFGPESTSEKYTPNPNIEADTATAKAVADALKNMGWTFASHGWGHHKMGGDPPTPFDSFAWDINMWMEEVVPIIGPTDIVIYPNGDDIGSWRGYTDDNEKYNYLKSLGFNYFCNVDSAVAWVQITNNYMRMGRRNLDGTRMFEAVCGYRDLLSDLFDSREVFDPDRPTPVKNVPVPTSEAAEENPS